MSFSTKTERKIITINYFEHDVLSNNNNSKYMLMSSISKYAVAFISY